MTAVHESAVAGAGLDGGPGAPIGFGIPAGMADIHRRLEVGLLNDKLEGVFDYRDFVLSQYFTDRPVYTLSWPATLYIPAEADYRQYWPVPPPADHRYTDQWADTAGGRPTASSASRADGRLFAWNNVSALSPGYVAFAGTGVRFAPKASLSYAKVTADVDLITQSRWWYLPGPAAGYASLSYRATAYVAGWHIDPVSGQWELLRPFGWRTLFDFTDSGQGGSAIHTRQQAYDDLSVTLQLQGGRTYAIGVSVEASIVHDCRDRQGQPYQKRPDDDIRLWASIAGTVSSIRVATQKVLIP